MSGSAAFSVPDLPFHLGPTVSQHNPAGLPDRLPFDLVFDPVRAMLVQRPRPELAQLLDRAYRTGQEIGTPLADNELGKPYADDFLEFIRARAGAPGRALEIGAGVGYLSMRLKDEGWRVDSLEPGIGYREQWARYGVEVINDYFPCPRAQGPYDLICAYAVLEHIPDPESLLASIRAHLRSGGKLALSVPDCGREIETGDPAMLIHEHYNYFDLASLRLLLARCGFAADVRLSGYGRALYAFATVAPPTPTDSSAEGPGLSLAASYPQRCRRFTARARAALRALADQGTVGIYCPTRALAVLPGDVPLRFFDDSPSLQGRYVPPFETCIEPRTALLASPTDSVVIMSHTFIDKLRRELMPRLPRTQVLGIAELAGQGIEGRDA